MSELSSLRSLEISGHSYRYYDAKLLGSMPHLEDLRVMMPDSAFRGVLVDVVKRLDERPKGGLRGLGIICRVGLVPIGRTSTPSFIHLRGSSEPRSLGSSDSRNPTSECKSWSLGLHSTLPLHFFPATKPPYRSDHSDLALDIATYRRRHAKGHGTALAPTPQTDSVGMHKGNQSRRLCASSRVREPRGVEHRRVTALGTSAHRLGPVRLVSLQEGHRCAPCSSCHSVAID
jgi:hypothetical protein